MAYHIISDTWDETWIDLTDKSFWDLDVFAQLWRCMATKLTTLGTTETLEVRDLGAPLIFAAEVAFPTDEDVRETPLRNNWLAEYMSFLSTCFVTLYVLHEYDVVKEYESGTEYTYIWGEPGTEEDEPPGAHILDDDFWDYIAGMSETDVYERQNWLNTITDLRAYLDTFTFIWAETEEKPPENIDFTGGLSTISTYSRYVTDGTAFELSLTADCPEYTWDMTWSPFDGQSGRSYNYVKGGLTYDGTVEKTLFIIRNQVEGTPAVTSILENVAQPRAALSLLTESVMIDTSEILWHTATQSRATGTSGLCTLDETRNLHLVISGTIAANSRGVISAGENVVYLAPGSYSNYGVDIEADDQDTLSISVELTVDPDDEMPEATYYYTYSGAPIGQSRDAYSLIPPATMFPVHSGGNGTWPKLYFGGSDIGHYFPYEINNLDLMCPPNMSISEPERTYRQYADFHDKGVYYSSAGGGSSYYRTASWAAWDKGSPPNISVSLLIKTRSFALGLNGILVNSITIEPIGT